MTLEQLRIFVAVAERQHMTRAAQALNMAQSAVSTAIASLEGRHRTKLFDRVGRGIELTKAGTLFLAEARGVLARVATAEALLDDLGGPLRGTLAVHASQTIASYWLPRHLVAFRRAHPGIEIRLGVGNTAQVADAVRRGESEVGFVEGLIEDSTLIQTEVARDRLVLVVAPGHDWARGEAPDPAAFAQGEWVLREPGSGTRSAFEAAWAERGCAGTPNIAMELPTNESVRAAVEAGAGASILSASVAAPSLEAGLLCLVDTALPDRAFRAMRHRERALGRAGEALLREVGRNQKVSSPIVPRL